MCSTQENIPKTHIQAKWPYQLQKKITFLYPISYTHIHVHLFLTFVEAPDFPPCPCWVWFSSLSCLSRYNITHPDSGRPPALSDGPSEGCENAISFECERNDEAGMVAAKKSEEEQKRKRGGLSDALTHVMMFKINQHDEPGFHKKMCLLHYSWNTDCLTFFRM